MTARSSQPSLHALPVTITMMTGLADTLGKTSIRSETGQDYPPWKSMFISDFLSAIINPGCQD
ncbi:MAG: hypothetical protein IPO77_22570 [Acidobacteria bacterium]|nr:hypothetical protein [Acidobacteriota bacterium]